MYDKMSAVFDLYKRLIKYILKFKFNFFIDMKSNKGLSSATIQSTDIHKT